MLFYAYSVFNKGLHPSCILYTIISIVRKVRGGGGGGSIPLIGAMMVLLKFP